MPDAIVIGGGFAGLSAAVRLVCVGARVLVLEARASLGGRASAFRDPKSGEWVDNGQHLMLGCYRHTLAFLDLIGARDRVDLQPRLEVPFVDPDGRRTTLRCPAWLPSPLHLLAGLLRWDAMPIRDRLSAFHMAAPLQKRASGDETIEQWLVRNKQARRLREMLWDPLAIAALNQEPGHAAAPYFSRVLAEMLAGGSDGTSLAIPKVPLHEMYAEPARAWLEARGAEVITGAPARISVRDGRVEAVRTRGREFKAPVIIAAVPWHALPTLIGGDAAPLAAVLDAASRTPPSSIVTVNLWVEGPLMSSPLVGLPGRLVQWVFDKRAILGRGASHLSLVTSAAAAIDDWPNDAIVDRAMSDLTAALPEMCRIRVVRANVVRERRATFSCAPGEPPRPGTSTSVPGLFLAGDWIDTGLPGTIESAVRSGNAAANAAAHLNR